MQSGSSKIKLVMFCILFDKMSEGGTHTKKRSSNFIRAIHKGPFEKDSLSATILCQAQGIGKRDRHDVLRRQYPQAAVPTGAFTEFGNAVCADILAIHQCRHRMPTVPFKGSRSRVIPADNDSRPA